MGMGMGMDMKISRCRAKFRLRRSGECILARGGKGKVVARYYENSEWHVHWEGSCRSV